MKSGNDAQAESQASTQASTVHDRLRDDILTGHLEPGVRLRLKELIEDYDTGNSPLREALNRLSANGLVTREDNRGFSVPPVSRDELEELLRTRCWLEEIALRESIANGDNVWEDQIVLTFHRLKKVTLSDDAHEDPTSAEWEKHHMAFHSALIAGCNSGLLVDICAQLQTRTLRYRNLAEVVEYRGNYELEEHRKLQEATLRRDKDVAIGLLHEHYTITMQILLESGRFN
jgi:DNA-binding GntR family transcriptional regulator